MVFKTVVGGEDFKNPKIMQKSKLKLRNTVLRSLPEILSGGITCNFNSKMVAEDCHSYQLTKEIVDKFMKIRLLRYGQYLTEMTKKKGKSGIRQKLNKSVMKLVASFFQ